MKILVTGATGFIGKHLIRELCCRSDMIVCAVRQTTDRTYLQEQGIDKIIDIDDDAEVLNALAGCDAVIHLAGRLGAYGVTFQEYYDTNCALTERMARLAVEAGVPQFMLCSTPGVYGFGDRLCIEEAPYAPRNDYERTKVIAERIVISMCEGTHTSYTIIRPDFVYGPGDRRRAAMYRNIARHRFALTTNGKSYLHPTYVDDVVQGFVLCLGNERAKNQIFNLAGETDITSEEYLRAVLHAGGGRVLVKINIGYRLSIMLASIIDRISKLVLKKEGFVTCSKIDFLALDHSSSINKAKNILGYSPEYSLQKGLEKTIAWCRSEGLV